MQLLTSGDADLPHPTINTGSEGLQRQFAVVAGLDWLLDAGGSISIKSGKQQRRFDLGTGYRKLVVNRLQLRASHTQRRTSTIGSFDFCAHHVKRLDDPGHRPAGERLISGKLAGKLLPCENATQHANGRTGVSAIERRARPPQPWAVSVDDDRATTSLPGHS